MGERLEAKGHTPVPLAASSSSLVGPMKILSTEFIKSCEKPEQFPHDGLPEVAFVGRSNVGKSSLLNSLLHRRGLARVSRTPGKTCTVNFFRVSTSDPLLNRFFWVDLPGYGYAKVSKSVRAQWGPMIEGYLTDRPELMGVLLLVDARGVERHDLATFEWLRTIGHKLVVVATKVDKLTRVERRGILIAIRQSLNVPGGTELIPYSSVTHEGRDELWRAIRRLLVASPG
ncbi:MAG TPA: ribosome biogenesis GTP-binding protein YihA/YsxC [Nitrospiraceae bacterium]|nr:ribosome biogenesis GTP-binding protein YihA/YsxC [Nitrospiraceae bacterium]